MASAIDRFLILIVLAGLHAPEAPARQFSVEIRPPDVQVCRWRVDHADERRCTHVSDGTYLGTVEDSDLHMTFFEFSAPSHFPMVLPASEVSTLDQIRLAGYPLLQWPGWSDRVETRLEWLPKDHNEWRELGLAKPNQATELPGETIAVRLSPRHGSPRTFFAARPRSSIAIRAVEPVRAGGEIALCTGRASEAVELRLPNGGTLTEKTAEHGCLSFAGLNPGAYQVFSRDEHFHSLTVVVENDQSTWLGTLPIALLATLRVKVEDSDVSHEYEVSIKPSASVAAQRVPAAKVLKGGSEAAWDLAAGYYEVTAEPRAFPSLKLTASIVGDAGAETLIAFRPRWVAVSGVAQRRKSAAAHIQLVFQREEEGVRSSVFTTTDGDGRFETILPAPGLWRISAAPTGQLQWKPHVVVHDVPLVDRHVFELELPGTDLSGRVVDASTGAPVADMAIEINWKDVDGFKLVTVHSDLTGRFAATNLPDETVTLRPVEGVARMHGYVPAAAQSVDLSHPPDEVIISMSLSQAIARLAVIDDAGRPVTDAQLYRASSHPAPSLIGRTDGNGIVDIPQDMSLPMVAYLVAAGHPWVRVVVADRGEDPVRVLLPAQTAATEIVFSGTSAFDDVPWGLIDESGLQVPLLHHLLRQGTHPVLRGTSGTIPTPGNGAYRIWVVRDGKTVVAGTVVLPSIRPIVVSLEGPAK